MKKIIITMLCLALIAGGGFFGYKKYKQAKDEKRIVDVVPVSQLSAEYSYFGFMMQENKTLDGTVISSNTQSISVDSQNEVKKVHVKLGDQVKKGDLLMEYDTTLLKLQIAQQEAAIGVKKQQLEKAKKELTRIKNLRPSEDRPAYYYTPQIPDEPEESLPDDPGVFIPERQVSTSLVDFSEAVEVDDDGTLYFDVSLDCNVSSSFMEQLISSQRNAMIRVCTNSHRILYIWQLDHDDEHITVHDWNVSNGVTASDGMVSYDGSANGECGQFFAYTGDIDDEPDETDYDEFYDDEPEIYDYEEPEYDENDENYMYSRSRLAEMVIMQEKEIKDIEFDIRSAELEYKENSKKAKDGKIYAKIDGIVSKIGDEKLDDGMNGFDEDEESDEESMDYEEDYSEFDDEMSDFNLDLDKSGKQKGYMIIRNNDSTLVKVDVYELDLASIKKGTILTGTSFETGDYIEAEVDSIEDVPSSYECYDYRLNPNNSVYSVIAHVTDEVQIPIDSYIEMELDNNSEEAMMAMDSDTIFIPVWYTHKEGTRYYVMKKGKNGRLVKQYVEAGQIMYDEVIEIKKGLDTSDMICFPYGKDVKEGVKTKETDKVLSIYSDGGVG